LNKLSEFVRAGRTVRLAKHVVSFGVALVGVIVGSQSSANATAAPQTINDYGVDHKSDLAVWRPANGTWYWIDSATGTSNSQQYGLPGDIPVSADYSYGLTADGKADRTVYRPSNGTFYWVDSQTGNNFYYGFGAQGDTPVSGDFDGDGKTDIAVWRHNLVSGAAAGTWSVIKSSTWSGVTTQWGQEGDIPVACDYDNDSKTDYAVWRPSNATWYIVNSSTGASWSAIWGQQGDVPVPGDYDHDGKCDIAIWRPSTGVWWTIASSTWTYTTTQWGMAGDRPVPTDHDGDGKTDMIVWRPSSGYFYGINSTNGATWGTALGSGGTNGGGIGSDVPLPNYPGMKNQLGDVVTPQQQSNWCWAATTQMAAAYSGVAISQCAEANVNSGRTDCCTNAASASDTAKCNQGGWWTLTSHGFTETDLWNSAISFTQLQNEINANRPVPFAWAWTGGGGHAMVVIDTWIANNGTQWVTKNDPLPVNTGAQIDLTYTSWVSSAGSYTHWRDSYNVIRTN
jgi:Papain-like cysteine protease AvrRpt2